MKSNQIFCLKFYLRADRKSSGLAPLYVRITVNGKVAYVSTNKIVSVNQWNQKAQKLKGNSIEDELVRDRMRLMAADINKAYDELRFLKEEITADKIKSKLLDTGESKSLSDLIAYHYEKPGELLTPGTLKNYYSTERFLKEFLKKKRTSDIALSKIDFKFVSDFGIYLRTKKTDKGQRPCTNNTVMKHMERFQKLTSLAMKFGWIARDPFLRFKRKIVTKDREVLTEEEINLLLGTSLDHTPSIVRDMFIFSCYTGLSFVEINSLAPKHISIDTEGIQWLTMQRKKTFNVTEKHFHVLLLPQAIEIVKRYQDALDSAYQETVFPCPSNQYTNRCLKLIAEAAGITKKLTFHTARHTFATTVTLEKGVSIESVSHMLGHSSIRTTQIYSKVKQKKVASEMKMLLKSSEMSFEN